MSFTEILFIQLKLTFSTSIAKKVNFVKERAIKDWNYDAVNCQHHNKTRKNISAKYV